VTSTDAPGRAQGRPRSALADRAILDAAAELFAECGFDGLTVEGVAGRAGVGKATIYRRYPSKVDLVIETASCLAVQRTSAPDTGSARGDLRALVANLVTFITTTPGGRMIPALVTETRRNPDLAEAHRRFIAERRAAHKAVVRRAIDRGELRADADVDAVVDLLVGPVFYRYLISRGQLDDAFIDALVETVMRAYGIPG
jgi:AcrR family transcriptional regulator